jgi:hypothetical protein
VAHLPGTPNQSSCEFLAFPKMGILLWCMHLGIIGATMSNEHLHCTESCLGACICGLGCKYKPFSMGINVFECMHLGPSYKHGMGPQTYTSEKPNAMVWGGVEHGPDSSGKPLLSQALLSVKTRWICSYDTWWASWGKNIKTKASVLKKQFLSHDAQIACPSCRQKLC